MMTSPGTGPIAKGTPANAPVPATQPKNVGGVSKTFASPAAAVSSAKAIGPPKVPLESFDVTADLEINGASVSLSGNITISQKGPAFEVDLSLMYFEVIIVSTNGIARKLDLGGNHHLNLSGGEIALIFSPGSRSTGSSYLAAMRQITIDLSSQLVRTHFEPPAARRDDAAARQAKATAARQQAIDTAATAAAQASQATTQSGSKTSSTKNVEVSHSSRNPAETPVIVKTKNITAQPVSGKKLLETVASLVSLIKSDKVDHQSKSMSHTYAQPIKTMTDNTVVHKQDSAGSGGQNIMKVLIDDQDGKGKVSIVHSILTEEPSEARGTIFDRSL